MLKLCLLRFSFLSWPQLSTLPISFFPTRLAKRSIRKETLNGARRVRTQYLITVLKNTPPIWHQPTIDACAFICFVLFIAFVFKSKGKIHFSGFESTHQDLAVLSPSLSSSTCLRYYLSPFPFRYLFISSHFHSLFLTQSFQTLAHPKVLYQILEIRFISILFCFSIS